MQNYKNLIIKTYTLWQYKRENLYAKFVLIPYAFKYYIMAKFDAINCSRHFSELNEFRIF